MKGEIKIQYAPERFTDLGWNMYKLQSIDEWRDYLIVTLKNEHTRQISKYRCAKDYTDFRLLDAFSTAAGIFVFELAVGGKYLDKAGNKVVITQTKMHTKGMSAVGYIKYDWAGADSLPVVGREVVYKINGKGINSTVDPIVKRIA